MRLFQRFPHLATALPFVSLGTWPTPVARLEAVERAAGLPPGTELWVKRDDLSGEPWGTSKVRKLEHYFGEARAQGARRVATTGPLGSNHALATAIYGHALGIEVLLELWPEPRVTPKIRETLLVEQALGARLALLGTAGEEALLALAAAKPADAGTYFIPPAGTDAVGATGYVEAGLELAEQVVGTPLDFVHVAGGTGGVAAGLAVGLAIAEAASTAPAPQVVAVRAVAKEILSDARLVLLSKRLVDRLAGFAGEPVLARAPGRERFRILHAHAGGGYALPTDEGARAADLFRAEAGLELDATYTAKAAAGALAFARSAEGAGKRHLFLHTYGSRDLSHVAGRARVEDLPATFRGFFQ